MIDVAKLCAAGIAPTQAKMFAEPLKAACALYDINSPVRVAAFIAQLAHESQQFTRMEESLYYRTPERILQMWPRRVGTIAKAITLTKNPKGLANAVYSNRMGNGDEASGDGWKYRGRGAIQLTGRDNYEAASKATGRPYLDQPDLVAQPSDACLTAAWFWHEHGCNALADTSQIDAITARINPAMAGKEDRREWFRESLTAFA